MRIRQFGTSDPGRDRPLLFYSRRSRQEAAGDAGHGDGALELGARIQGSLVADGLGRRRRTELVTSVFPALVESAVAVALLQQEVGRSVLYAGQSRK